MMKVTIKNAGTSSITDIPLSSLIPGALPAATSLAPDASVDVVYLIPPTNDAVVTAVKTWADSNGHVVELTFTPHVIERPAVPVAPTPLVDPFNPPTR